MVFSCIFHASHVSDTRHFSQSILGIMCVSTYGSDLQSWRIIRASWSLATIVCTLHHQIHVCTSTIVWDSCHNFLSLLMFVEAPWQHHLWGRFPLTDTCCPQDFSWARVVVVVGGGSCDNFLSLLMFVEAPWQHRLRERFPTHRHALSTRS
jgi:hypothetical protein